MKSMRQIITLFCLSFFMTNSFSQNTILKLWPDGIPGSIKNEAYSETPVETKEIGTIYTKVTDPTISVYLPAPGKATGTAVLICPGGGYEILASSHEGNDIAKWLNENGIAGIVLKYRLPSDIIMKDKSVGPLQDVQEAMRIIRRKSEEWKINPKKVGVIGFSAGGHLASTLSTHYSEKVYSAKDTVNARPDFSILIYPVISFDASFTHTGSRNNLIGKDPSEEAIKHFSNELQITKDTPPAFLVHSSDDEVVPVKNSLLYYENLLKNKVTAELHLFQKGGHGYGLAINKPTQSAWPELCIKWLNANGF
jgi:acetyl esterase/lipase